MGDLVELSASALRMALPVLITALGAIYAERSGVVNIGLEGMMLTGAFWGAYGAVHYGAAAGVLLAVLMAAALALVHALMCIRYRVDQIVSGVAINLLAYGLARLLSLTLFGTATTSPHVSPLPRINVPLPEALYMLKPLLTGLSPLIPLGLALVPLSLWIIEKTVFGLRLKAVGENPLAADSLGISVNFYRYTGVLLSGAFAGLAGAFLAIEHTGMYVEGMTQGKGFIALAAMIFGNWSPTGALSAALLFGFAESASFRMVDSKLLPYQFIKMLPYVLTLLVLAGVGKKTHPPAAAGQPYSREES